MRAKRLRWTAADDTQGCHAPLGRTPGHIHDEHPRYMTILVGYGMNVALLRALATTLGGSHMKRLALVALTLSVTMVFAAASPAFAATGAEFGAHHAVHAIEMGGFSADMNPGVHQGFAGWTGP